MSDPELAYDSEIRRRFAERYTATVHRVAETVSPYALARALGAADEISGLAEALHAAVDMPRASDSLVEARLRGLTIKQKLLRESGGAFTVGQVAEMLAVTPEAIHQRRRRGRLLAVKEPNGQWAYPAFQFDPVRLANEIGEVLAAFRVDDPWTRLSVLLSEAPSLGGARPIEALRDGDVRGAREAVASFGLPDQEQGAPTR